MLTIDQAVDVVSLIIYSINIFNVPEHLGTVIILSTIESGAKAVKARIIIDRVMTGGVVLSIFLIEDIAVSGEQTFNFQNLLQLGNDAVIAGGFTRQPPILFRERKAKFTQTGIVQHHRSGINDLAEPLTAQCEGYPGRQRQYVVTTEAVCRSESVEVRECGLAA